jgi:hypothetical protein
MEKKICQFKAAHIDEGSLVDHTIYYTTPREAYRAAYRHWRSSDFVMLPCNGLAAVVKEDAYRSWKRRNAFVLGWKDVQTWMKFCKIYHRIVSEEKAKRR